MAGPEHGVSYVQNLLGDGVDLLDWYFGHQEVLFGVEAFFEAVLLWDFNQSEVELTDGVNYFEGLGESTHRLLFVGDE